MHPVEALDSLILVSGRQPASLLPAAHGDGGSRSAWPLRGSWWRWPWKNGWQGDLWRCCIARELVSSENTFSPSRGERHSGGQTHWKHWHWQI